MQNKSSCVVSLKDAVHYVSDISDLKNFINQWTDVYRIKITTEISKRKISGGLVKNNTKIKEYNYYIADEIKTAGELLDADDKEFQPPINNENKNVPALIVGITPSMLTGFGLRKDIWSPATEFKTKPIVEWHKLNCDTDIVLNRNLKQIYPYKTGKIPKAIEHTLRSNQYTTVKIERIYGINQIAVLYSQEKQR